MPKEEQRSTRSSHRPVSCRFCRTRKLRCSRTIPCSNCVARGIACDLENSSTAPSTSNNSEVLQRLDRLENLLAAKNTEEQERINQPSPSLARTQVVDVNSVKQIPSAAISRSKIALRTCPVGKISNVQSYIRPLENPSVAEAELTRYIWLPPRAEAQVLLEKVIRIAHYLPYAPHTPSLFSTFEQVYTDLQQQRQVQPGQVVLLLSIFAASTYFWVQSDCAYGLFSTSAEANNQTLTWIKAAEEILDIACRLIKVSIEGLQGAVVLGSVVAHLEGLHRYRALFGMSIVLARDLGLHRIDHPSNAATANTARAEIGRRIWWYLCSSDWIMAARVGGTVEGVYSCHPRQMITKKPLHINDDELSDGMSRDERPLSQPTAMSYTTQKIRLAEISRSIVDRSPIAMAHTSGLSHDSAMDIDTELQTLINDVPAFYSMTDSTLMKTYGLTKSQAENIVFQGKMIYFLFYSQRCKLHLPYFSRSFENLAYCSSREICLKYGRLIIQSELWQEKSDSNTAVRFKFTELLTGVFLACIVLLMDLCLNPLSPQYHRQREEVHKSFKIMEQAKSESETSSKFVDSLIRILRKYNVPSVNAITSQDQQPSEEVGGDAQQMSQVDSGNTMVLDIPEDSTYGEYGEIAFSGDSHSQFGASDGVSLAVADEGPLNESGDDLISYWSDFTRNFDQGLDANGFDWDNMFLELDSSLI